MQSCGVLIVWQALEFLGWMKSMNEDVYPRVFSHQLPITKRGGLDTWVSIQKSIKIMKLFGFLWKKYQYQMTVVLQYDLLSFLLREVKANEIGKLGGDPRIFFSFFLWERGTRYHWHWPPTNINSFPHRAGHETWTWRKECGWIFGTD